MRNPTLKELLASVRTETNAAAALASAASPDGFTRAQGDEMVRLLSRASAAMEALQCRIRGIPPPTISP